MRSRRSFETGSAIASEDHVAGISASDSRCKAAGINIEQFRVQLTPETHLDVLHRRDVLPGLGNGGVWNESWNQFFKGGQRSQAEIFQHAADLVVGFEFPYFSPVD